MTGAHALVKGTTWTHDYDDQRVAGGFIKGFCVWN